VRDLKFSAKSGLECQLISVPADPLPGLSYERRGSVVRVVGQHRDFIDTARNVGAQGATLDALITAPRDFFAQRGEAVEWKTRGHDEPRICQRGW